LHTQMIDFRISDGFAKDICVSYGNMLDIVFNAKKSCLFKASPMHRSEVKNFNTWR